MADFVADDSQSLIVGHDVQQPRIYSHASVRACKCIDIVGLVHLEIERGAVHFGQSLGHSPYSLDISVRLRKDGVLLVELGDGLGYICRHLLVCESGCLSEFLSA